MKNITPERWDSGTWSSDDSSTFRFSQDGLGLYFLYQSIIAPSSTLRSGSVWAINSLFSLEPCTVHIMSFRQQRHQLVLGTATSLENHSFQE